MNKYYKWYLAIINNRKTNILTKQQQYCEIHHIIPKALGGTNDKDNLVALTAREHYVCHCLLVKHFECINNISAFNKMLLAWNRISHDKKHNVINSYLYEKLKIKNSLRARQFKHSEETIDKLREKQRGKKSSLETKLKQSKSLKGKTKPQSMKNAISKRVKDTTVIYNPITDKTKQIKKDQLEIFLNDGWLHQHSPKVKQNKSKETAGANNPCYGKKWIYNVKTDEQLYLQKDDAEKLIASDNNWKFGLNDKMHKKLALRKSRKPFSEEEKQHASEIMKNRVWMLDPKTNKKKRPLLNDVKKCLDKGWLLISKKYKVTDFV